MSTAISAICRSGAASQQPLDAIFSSIRSPPFSHFFPFFPSVLLSLMHQCDFSLNSHTSSFVSLIQVGIPLFMYLVMRFHQIPEIKKKKVGNSLVTSMITEYVAATTTASSQRLASFLGMKRDANLVSRERQAAEFDRRTEVCGGTLKKFVAMTTSNFSHLHLFAPGICAQELYLEIFPEHQACGDGCNGHNLPDLPARILKEMDYPPDLKALVVAARAWFERVDVDASGTVDRKELTKEFARIGITENAAFCIWQVLHAPTSRATRFVPRQRQSTLSIYPLDI